MNQYIQEIILRSPSKVRNEMECEKMQKLWQQWSSSNLFSSQEARVEEEIKRHIPACDACTALRVAWRMEKK